MFTAKVKIDRAQQTRNMKFNWQSPTVFILLWDSLLTACWSVTVLLHIATLSLTSDIDAHVGWQEVVHLLHVSAAESLVASLSRAVLITSAILIAVSAESTSAPRLRTAVWTIHYHATPSSTFHVYDSDNRKIKRNLTWPHTTKHLHDSRVALVSIAASNARTGSHVVCSFAVELSFMTGSVAMAAA